MEYSAAFCGGMILGMSSSSKTLFTGRVLGVSGSIKGMLKINNAFPFAFVGAMIGGSFIAKALFPPALQSYQGLEPWWLFSCGVIVGLGTYLCNGCTSGHGIAGIGRASRRSLKATSTFFGVAVITATASNSSSFITSGTSEPVPLHITAIIFGASIASYVLIYILAKTILLGQTYLLNVLVELVSGVSFSLGLVAAGMNQPINVARFLDLRGHNWTGALVLVMIGALCIKFTVHHSHTAKRELTLLGTQLSLPCPKAPADLKLYVGSVLFGIGWALSGICPGPALTMLAQEDPISGVSYMGGLLTAYSSLTLLDVLTTTPKENATINGVLPDIQTISDKLQVV